MNNIIIIESKGVQTHKHLYVSNDNVIALRETTVKIKKTYVKEK